MKEFAEKIINQLSAPSINDYMLSELFLPYMDRLDDTSLLILAYQSMIRICRNNGYVKDSDGNVIKPCNPNCHISRTIGCTELEDIRQRIISIIDSEGDEE